MDNNAVFTDIDYTKGDDLTKEEPNKKDKNKCTKCKTYYKSTEDLCSECNIEYGHNNLKKAGVTLNITDILNLPQSSFKGRLLQENINDVYKHYQTIKFSELAPKREIIQTDNKAKALVAACSGKDSGEIFAILDGHRDFPKCLLLAKYAYVLLVQCFKNTDETKRYTYIHAIAPFVLDIWNFPSEFGVLDCYYRQFGELNKCPIDQKKIYNLWRRADNPYFKHDLSDAKLCKCLMCNKTLRIRDNLIKCKKCLSYMHKTCLVFVKGKDTKCKKCGVIFPLIPSNFGHIIQNGKIHKIKNVYML